MKMKKSIDEILATLDPEEKDLLDSLEREEWRSVPNLEEEKKRLQQIARNTLVALKKDCRVNIRMAQQDLDGIKARAVEEGIPYQTLMASVLHKYVTGRLVEKQRQPS